MKRLLVCLLAAVCLVAAPPPKPKLVLAIVLDQFRYDYANRFRSEYTGGFDRLLTHGAVFTNANYIHFPTVTAVGHSTVLTGAIPALSGIIGNEWYDREERKQVTSVGDTGVRLLGAGEPAGGTGRPGSSPRRLLVDTIGDELKMAHEGKPRVIGISLKDRAAILPAGHKADAAYWFDSGSGSFVSSSYYFSDLPDWVKQFNATRPADKYSGLAWLDHKMPTERRALYAAVDASPFGNEIEERFAERAIEAEKLGQRDTTDLLAISFSSHDYVGHQYGPFSPEEREVSLAMDKALARIFNLLDTLVGMKNVLVVLTADHGVAPMPGSEAAARMPGGRISPGAPREAVQKALAARYGPGNWVVGTADGGLYLNLELAAQSRIDPAEMRREAASAVAAIPHVFRAYTRDQILGGQLLPDGVDRRIAAGYNVKRGADIEAVPDPYWIFNGPTGTTHGGPFGYDTHVPIVFMGSGIRAGRYYASVQVNDIAPTLAAILDIETPSGSVGRVLAEMFEEQEQGATSQK